MGTKFKSQKKKKKKKKQKSKNVLNSSNQNCAIAVPHAHKWRMPPCLLFHYIAIASSVEGERDFDFKKKKTLPNQTKKISFLYKKRRKETEWMFSCQAAFKIVDMNVSTWSLIASFKFGIAFDMMCIMFIVSALGVEDLPFSSIAAHFSPLFCIFSL